MKNKKELNATPVKQVETQVQSEKPAVVEQKPKRKHYRKPKQKQPQVQKEEAVQPQVVFEITDRKPTKKANTLWQRFLNWMNEPISIKIKLKHK